jgi:ATP-dependent DNA helicase RecQ
VFCDQERSLQQMQQTSPDLLLAWHWLTTRDQSISGLNRFFMVTRHSTAPSTDEARTAITRLLDEKSCTTASRQIIATAADRAWPLAYALAWLSVAGGNSVMPPWVRHQFPEAGRLIRQLRDTPCTAADCAWCQREHDALKQLQHWFGKATHFAPNRLTRTVGCRCVDHCRKRHARRAQSRHPADWHRQVAVLPDSRPVALCPHRRAVGRHLAAGRADGGPGQGLRERGIDCCAAINRLLNMPERADVLDRVRLGDVGILLIAPEQLRNRSVRKVLAQREIGAWIFDEAHCLSKWGQDFRPDYRYVARFIAESRDASPDKTLPLIQCLTATAKPEVVADIVGHFRDKLGIAMRVLDGGARRDNLRFDVIPTTPGEKYDLVGRLIADELPPEKSGGVIAYCATRKQTEELAQFLRQGPGGRGLSRPPAAGNQEEHAKSIHRRRIARHRRHQRLRHGHRQTRRAPGRPRRHPRFAGKLPAGSRPGRARPGGGALRAALHRRRRRAPAQHVGQLPPVAARHPERAARPARFSARKTATSPSSPPRRNSR